MSDKNRPTPCRCWGNRNSRSASVNIRATNTMLRVEINSLILFYVGNKSSKQFQISCLVIFIFLIKISRYSIFINVIKLQLSDAITLERQSSSFCFNSEKALIYIVTKLSVYFRNFKIANVLSFLLGTVPARGETLFRRRPNKMAVVVINRN